MDTNQTEQLFKLLDAIREAIEKAGFIPRGYLYSALMEHGCTFSQYEQLEGLLLADGQVRRQGDLLVWHTHQEGKRTQPVLN